MSGTLCCLYLGVCYKALSWENEYFRMGVAGSVASIICDMSFHCLDTVNIRAKAAAVQS